VEGAVDGPICRDHGRKALHELIPVRKRYLDLLTPDAVPNPCEKGGDNKDIESYVRDACQRYRTNY
jgi:hypothetical protein